MVSKKAKLATTFNAQLIFNWSWTFLKMNSPHKLCSWSSDARFELKCFWFKIYIKYFIAKLNKISETYWTHLLKKNQTESNAHIASLRQNIQADSNGNILFVWSGTVLDWTNKQTSAKAIIHSDFHDTVERSNLNGKICHEKQQKFITSIISSTDFGKLKIHYMYDRCSSWT